MPVNTSADGGCLQCSCISFVHGTSCNLFTCGTPPAHAHAHAHTHQKEKKTHLLRLEQHIFWSFSLAHSLLKHLQLGQFLSPVYELHLFNLHVPVGCGRRPLAAVLALVLGGCQLLSVRLQHNVDYDFVTTFGTCLSSHQVVDSNGQEDVEQGVVPEERENDEIQRVDVARPVAALGLDALIHHLVPVLTGQDLKHWRIDK